MNKIFIIVLLLSILFACTSKKFMLSDEVSKTPKGYIDYCIENPDDPFCKE